jgi:TonB-dependent receptor
VNGNGNPYLKPYLAWNADSSLDYYLNRVSYASIAGFYKKISNFVSQVGVQRELLGYEFLDTRLRNAQSATVYGAEFTLQTTFDFLPSPFDGFGFSANYTKVNSSQTFDPSLTTQVFNVEGLSDSANLVLFYEKGPVQIRGAYNWRAGFLRHTNNGFVAGQPENVDPYGQYDVSASYAISPNISIYVQAVNITNALSRSFQAYEERLLNLEETGRQLQFGVRGHF